MIRHITKIKTYWDESPNSRAIIYFAYKDVGICRIQINEGDNFATLYGLYVDEKYRNAVFACKDAVSAKEVIEKGEVLGFWNEMNDVITAWHRLMSYSPFK